MSWRLPLISIVILILTACVAPSTSLDDKTSDTASSSENRIASIPAGTVKVTPFNDPWQPVASAGWSKPEPLGEAVNTAGGEDSPFITSDGLSLYFFFTPDVNIPAEKQIYDGVTGIWVAHLIGTEWSQPDRVLLANPNLPHLDGCPFVLADWMVFCSARKGNKRPLDLYTANLKNGEWVDWQNWGKLINEEYQVGEVHITADGKQLYFSSSREGGVGGYDLWVSNWTGDKWGNPINLGAPINTAGDEGRPFISLDGQELWFDGISGDNARPGPAIFRSLRQPDGTWSKPEEIISSFAGEPSLTGDGKTLYFVHHYFDADLKQMIEADIYISHRLEP